MCGRCPLSVDSWPGLGGAGVAEARPLVLSAVDAALARCKTFLNQIELEEKDGFNVK